MQALLNIWKWLFPWLGLPSPPDLTGQIDKESYRYPVAQGNSADVWKCKIWSYPQKLAAVKCLRIDIPDDNFKQRFTEKLKCELRQYAQLKHSNLLPLLGTTQGFGPLPAIITPWMHKGSLTILLERDFQYLANHQKMRILMDVASALQYLHSKHIAHGDLTSNNILVDENNTAFVADHGVLTLCSEFSGTSYITSNVRWKAPETFRISDDKNPTTLHLACDIYSFGCIMLQIITGRVPYSEYRSDHQVVVQILRDKKPTRPMTPHIEEILWDFIQECWSDAAHRPLATAVLEFIRSQLEVQGQSHHRGSQL